MISQQFVIECCNLIFPEIFSVLEGPCEIAGEPGSNPGAI
jgi:hypothetical protein